MSTRDLLLVLGVLRVGQMFPAAVLKPRLSAERSLKFAHAILEEHETANFGKPSGPIDDDDMRRRAAITSWSGEILAVGTRIEEVPDPGVILCLLYEGPARSASLPVDVFAQTLRRFALRDKALRAKFEEHVEKAGTYVPAWLSPEVRRRKSQEAFDQAMKAAREQGFAFAVPLFEGVRGEHFPEAQIAIALQEAREHGNVAGAIARLDEVVRIAPRNAAARMQRAALYMRDPGGELEAARDYLAILHGAADAGTSVEIRALATEKLWELHREFDEPSQLDAAARLVAQDPERGFDALSRYVQTHPCAWFAHVLLARAAVTRQRFDLAAKLLKDARSLFPDDPSPHFVYGQALTATGHYEAGMRALEVAAALAPDDADIRSWILFSRQEQDRATDDEAPSSVEVALHVARAILVMRGIVWNGRVYPAVTSLSKLPGDLAMAFVLQAAAAQDQRIRSAADPDAELRLLSERADLSDYAGDALSIDGTVGDLADPGVVLVVLYDTPARDAAGKLVLHPPPSECRAQLLNLVAHDSRLSAKVDRHLKSADARHKARLEL